MSRPIGAFFIRREAAVDEPRQQARIPFGMCVPWKNLVLSIVSRLVGERGASKRASQRACVHSAVEALEASVLEHVVSRDEKHSKNS